MGTRMDAPPEEDELLGAFRDVVLEGWLLQKQLAHGHRLSMVQYMLLRRLSARESARPSELAEEFGVSPPAITLLIGGLETRGWVRRSPSPEDRRSVAVVLTPRARRALRAIDARRQRITTEAVAVVPAAQRAMLTGSLRSMGRHLRQARAESAARRRPQVGA